MEITKVYELLSSLHVDEDNVFDYMKGYVNWLKMEEKRWIPTPCRIVYRGQNDKLIVLPFLDIKKTPYAVWGIEIGNTYFCLNHEAAVCASDLTRPNFLEQLGEKINDDSFMFRGFKRSLGIPTVDEMRRFAENRLLVEETVKICDHYGYDNDLLVPDVYWTTDEIGSPNLHVVELTNKHFRVHKQRSAKQTCRVQVILRYNQFKDLTCSVDEFGVPCKTELKKCLCNIQ